VQGTHLHVVTIDNLASFAGELAAASPSDNDVILVLPSSGTLSLGSSDELIEACLGLEGGICVAASPIRPSSGAVAAKIADAVARATGWSPISRATGWRPARAYPYPYALLGPVRAMSELAARVYGWSQQGDADLMATVLLEGGHPLVLDTAAQVFHVLDGTGTDVVAAAGRAHSGGEQPLVVLDPVPGAPSLARLEADLDDAGGWQLARLLRYEGAADPDDTVWMPADDILVVPFWTPPFCATIVRAAEVAGVWSSLDDQASPRSEVPLSELSPRLISLTEQDLRTRIWPIVASQWPQAASADLYDAVIVRQEAGDALAPLDQRDEGEVGMALRLNDGYSGEGVLFPRQGWSNREAPLGSLSMWPAGMRHAYRLESVTRGVQYLLNLYWRPRRVRGG
jgi:hypothetical protein